MLDKTQYNTMMRAPADAEINGVEFHPSPSISGRISRDSPGPISRPSRPAPCFTLGEIEVRVRKMTGDALPAGTPRRFTSSPPRGCGEPDIDRVSHFSGVAVGVWSEPNLIGRRELIGRIDIGTRHYGGPTVKRRRGSVYPRKYYTPLRAPFTVNVSRRSVWRSVYRPGDAGEWVIEDRAYCWSVRRALRESMSGDFIESSAPVSVEIDDGQAGLGDFDGEALAPCGHSEIRSCSCCTCAAAGHAGIRHRKTKEPAYACNSPNCDWTGDRPIVRPARSD